MTPRSILRTTLPNRRSRRGTRLLASFVLFLFACGESTVRFQPDPKLDIDLSEAWREASVEEVGGSTEIVALALEDARANDRLTSLLVAKDGYLVVEEYYATASELSLLDVRSVTKSIVSALTGIAVAGGEIRDVEAPAADYLDEVVDEIDPAKRRILVEHLLAMTSGLEWDEPNGLGSYLRWVASRDPDAYVLENPLVATPGSVFNYNSGAAHLLGVVVREATGLDLPELADQTLFEPMGIARSRWEHLRDGSHNGGAGIDLRARDLARFGQLYLQGGSSGGRQIVPQGWVEQSTESGFDWRFDLGALKGISYGYLWWVAPEAAEPLYFAWGLGGQYIVVVPDLRLVVVTTTQWARMGDSVPDYERRTMDMIVERVIPAFR